MRGSYDAALRPLPGQGTEPGDRPEVAATSFYNLSLAHLQKFEYQAYNEAKSNADRLAPGLVADYDRWKYDSGDYAVVDLGLSRERGLAQVRRVPSRESAVRNARRGAPAGGGPGRSRRRSLNRFTASAVVFALVAVPGRRWRGPQGLHAPLLAGAGRRSAASATWAR